MAPSETVFRRGLPPVGVYGCVKTGGFVPFMIRALTKSWADHVFISIGDGQIVEAEPGGVRIRDVSEYAGCRIEYNTAEPMTDMQRAAVAEYASSKRGEPYAWTADAVDGLRCLGLRWRILAWFERARRSVMCSELAVQAGQYAGLDWSCGQGDPSCVTPAMLARRLDAQTWRHSE
ncbi:hypothetical protein Caci_2860 [Catenulispora acidiphila DSM 44928]|uniref:Uncharacterized protein n=1 Tax=Catenulispora acidiphila (strain DSM 44928 / JCM 14897 / NBRC 102108 / NRRL B-24433 / ID139908) TaxID=479433 RepID=C7Q194_CATAD|nr:hypothetical protein [Catenulispora acidiphila]ACU71769.1 hypothetical protein Caci_2860 [Catenulispora acidiphila DSM 44928]